jgi:hypothetical protein
MFPNNSTPLQQFGHPTQNFGQSMEVEMDGNTPNLTNFDDGSAGQWRIQSAIQFTQELMQIPLGQLITWYLGAQGTKPLESWLPVVTIQPPWSMENIVKVVEKHWLSVFCEVYPRSFKDGPERKNGAGIKKLLDLVKKRRHSVQEQTELLNQLETLLSSACDAKGVDQSQIDVASAWLRIAPLVPMQDQPNLTGRPAWQVRNVFLLLKAGLPDQNAQS